MTNAAPTTTPRPVPGDTPSDRSLAHRLRADGATSVKIGCEEGACGACTVLVGGEPLPSCLVPAWRHSGPVTTAAEVAATPFGHHLARSLADHGGLQCGFCTPGILVTMVALVESTPSAGVDDVRNALRSHLCRCTGYRAIVDAVVTAIETRS